MKSENQIEFIEMAEELPYKAEYAKSGRAGCKGCKLNIEKDTLRLAVMVRVSISMASLTVKLILIKRENK